VLQQLGFGVYRARQAAMKFRRHNLDLLQKLYPHYKDQQRFMSLTRQGRDELESMFANDAETLKARREDGWD
jgi:glutathione-regulated potassium-efflux system ancillary protein KefC